MSADKPKENQVVDASQVESSAPKIGELNPIAPTAGVRSEDEIQSEATAGVQGASRKKSIGGTRVSQDLTQPSVLEMQTIVKKTDSISQNDANTLQVPVERVDSQQSARSSQESSRNTNSQPKERRVFEINQIFEKHQQDRKFCDNRVTTTKYTCLNFVPKNLFIQFTKIANAYFLFCVLIQIIPGVGPPNGAIFSAFPLIFVVGISMIKDAFEDHKRRKQDTAENLAAVTAAARGSKQLQKMQSLQLQVGCIVKVCEDQTFPADLMLLKSSLPKGICYVETKNLDGETNLKQKQAQEKIESHVKDQSDEQVLDWLMSAQIECETPNEYLYKFEGNFVFSSGERIPLDPDQILLKGSNLRNTEYVYGLCVFTGHDTKIMNNSAAAEAKFSKNAKFINRLVLFQCLIQILFSLIGSIILSIWTEYDANEMWYLYPKQSANLENFWVLFFYNLGVWFIALMNFVPISLLVTLEMINFIQAFFIVSDIMIYDVDRDLPAKVQQSGLNEELGMVNYIFSDKTGTLTQNIMEFQKFSAGEYKFGVDDPANIEYAPGVTNVNFDDPEMYKQLKDVSHPNHGQIKRFFEALGLCHTVITDTKQTKEGQDYIVYNASSPDELALVNGARHLGFSFESRDDSNNMVCQTWDGERKYKLLNVIEFDSTRKRMTVIVKTPEDKILVICKGADSIIEKRLKPGQSVLQQTKKYLDEFALTGLRTLLIASKEISQSEYDSFAAEYLKAATSINREKEMNKVSDALEQEFDLIGSSAIEDKLQEEVGQTIYNLRQAQIKVWVLTGDKVETAMNIGMACKLLDNEMNTFIMQSLRLSKVKQEIQKYYEQQSNSKAIRDNAVVVAGETLALIQQHADVQEKFVDLCEGANVVLACRVSPKQKAEVVNMIKYRHPKKTTLAIGDGANDVNMITAAHIGVGISGLEGQQAAKAADYAIGKFKYLANLLFVHGRESYRRNSYSTTYIFYKNILISSPLFFYGFFSKYSGLLIYHVLMYMAYNVAFTALPVIWFATNDFEHSKETLLSEPEYYKFGPRQLHLNVKTYIREVLYGFLQAILILYFSFISLTRDSSNQEGFLGSLVDAGDFVFACAVIVANVKILVASYQIGLGITLTVALSIIGYIVFATIVSETTMFQDTEFYVNQRKLATFPAVYFALFLFIFSFALIDRALERVKNVFLKWANVKIDLKEEENQKEQSSKPNLVQDKQTSYAHTGYAFSQEAGHAKLVTGQLSRQATMSVNQKLEDVLGSVLDNRGNTSNMGLLQGHTSINNHYAEDGEDHSTIYPAK